MNSDRIKFFIAATWILALIITAAVVPMATIKSLPHWFDVVIVAFTIALIFTPVIQIGGRRKGE